MRSTILSSSYTTARLLICRLKAEREVASRPDVVWDRVPYLCSYKGKTTAFGKFSVVFRYEKSVFALTK